MFGERFGRWALVWGVGAALVLVGCGKDDDGTPSDATGAAPASGGAAGDATGGMATGGLGDGGAGPGGTATGGAAGSTSDEGFLVDGVNGRVEVLVLPDSDLSGWASTAMVSAMFFAGPLRLDAFAPYAASVQEVAVAEGDCTLFVAATRACNPPCDFDQTCGEGDVCVPIAAVTDAGLLTVAGDEDSVTLTPEASYYAQAELPATNLVGTISASAAGGPMAAFALDAPGVAAPTFDLVDGTLTLVDGADYELTWTPLASGTVQLLLNSGWHGAPPVATLVCEVPASAGRLVIPQAAVEAYPAEGGFGLFPHSSYLTAFERERATVDGGVVEFVVGWRQGVTVLH